MKWWEMTNCPHCGKPLQWNGGSTDWDGAVYDAECIDCGIMYTATERMEFEVDEDEWQ